MQEFAQDAPGCHRLQPSAACNKELAAAWQSFQEVWQASGVVGLPDCPVVASEVEFRQLARTSS